MVSRATVDAFIALGSNLGDRLGNLRRAVAAIARDVGEVTAASSVYETDPVGYLSQPRFLNAVIRVRTALTAREVLERLLTIESKFGRIRSFANAPRTLDLDLIFYDDLIVKDPGLVVPHPRLHQRAFVLVPLAEVAPDLIHPSLGASVRTLLAALPEISDVRLFADRLCP